MDSKEIYGRSYGMVYLCRNCGAYVGVHKGTDKPLGRLADAELRRWKMAAHNAFDPIWKYGKFRHRRNAAYAVEQTHSGMFDVAQCQQVIQIMNNERRFQND